MNSVVTTLPTSVDQRSLPIRSRKIPTGPSQAQLGFSDFIRRMKANEGKTCGRCDEFKPFTAFQNDASRPDGKCSNCRECRKTS
jgi:hypothetical protein